MATKKVNEKIAQFKAEWEKIFEEKQDNKTKSSVFRILGAIADINKQKETIALQMKLLDERQKELEAELASLN